MLTGSVHSFEQGCEKRKKVSRVLRKILCLIKHHFRMSNEPLPKITGNVKADLCVKFNQRVFLQNACTLILSDFISLILSNLTVTNRTGQTKVSETGNGIPTVAKLHALGLF